MKTCGRAFKYGDNVDTNVIIPTRYSNTTQGDELVKHYMEDINKEFVDQVQKGDVIMANKNFGRGSPRKHTPLATERAGVNCTIVETSVHIFYRSSINIDLPVIECRSMVRSIEVGGEVETNFGSGIITNKTKGGAYKDQSLPLFIQKIVSAGGPMNYVNGQ